MNALIDCVYEVVDSTDDDRYWPVGIFLDKQEAIEVARLTPPDELPADRDSNDDVCRIDVIERRVGLHGAGKRVERVMWQEVYDSKVGEYRWGRIVEQPEREG